MLNKSKRKPEGVEGVLALNCRKNMCCVLMLIINELVSDFDIEVIKYFWCLCRNSLVFVDSSWIGSFWMHVGIET